MTASAVFTRDGKTVLVGDGGGNVVFWDVATGRELRRVSAGPGVVHSLAITPDGKTLAVGGWGGVTLWDVAAGKMLSAHKLHDDAVMQMHFTPDGKTLALRYQGDVIHLWDIGSEKPRKLKGHTGKVSSTDLSPDGRTLASGAWGDKHLRLWDVATGAEKRRIAAYNRDVVNLAFSPDGKRIVTNGNVGGVRFWDAATGEPIKQKVIYHAPLQFAFSPDGKMLVGLEGDGRLHYYDPATGKPLRASDTPPRSAAGLVFSPDGKTIATFWGGSNTFDLWDATKGELLHPAPGHRHWLTAVVFSADDRTLFSASGLSDPPTHVWDVQTGERAGGLGDNPNGVQGLALSPDGELLAACGYNDNTIRLWDVATRKEVRTLKGHTSVIVSVAWSADGKTLVSGSYYDKTIRLWDVATGAERRKIESKQEWVGSVVISPDGAEVAAGGFRDGSVRLWSAATGAELRRIATPHGTVSALAYSPDGSVLASGGWEGGICLWDAATGRELRRWDVPTGYVGDLAFSTDGRTLVSGNRDASVHLWESETGHERATVLGHRALIRAVAISRDGRRIASGSDDTTVVVWDATAGARPGAALSGEELQTLWRDLTGADAARAYRAMWRLALAPEKSLPFLAERLRPVRTLDAAGRKRAERLLADLDDEQFAVRQKAEEGLGEMGPPVETVLREALDRKPSLEVRRRAEKVLETLVADRRGSERALEAVERANTPEARRLLEALTGGEPRAWLTRQARAALARLGP